MTGFVAHDRLEVGDFGFLLACKRYMGGLILYCFRWLGRWGSRSCSRGSVQNQVTQRTVDIPSVFFMILDDFD